MNLHLPGSCKSTSSTLASTTTTTAPLEALAGQPRRHPFKTETREFPSSLPSPCLLPNQSPSLVTGIYSAFPVSTLPTQFLISFSWFKPWSALLLVMLQALNTFPCLASVQLLTHCAQIGLPQHKCDHATNSCLNPVLSLE